MSEKPLSQRIQEGLVPDLVSEIKALELRLAESDALCIKLAHQKGDQVDEMRELNSRLAKAKDLLVDNYPCYGEDKCKNCKGDFGEIDYRTCIGYNVSRALRREG